MGDVHSANSEQGFTQSAGDGGCWGTYVEKMERLEAAVRAVVEEGEPLGEVGRFDLPNSVYFKCEKALS